MSPSLEMQVRVAELRQKARDKTLTLEETKEAIAFLRQERMAMAPAKASAKKQVNIDADELLKDLGI